MMRYFLILNIALSLPKSRDSKLVKSRFIKGVTLGGGGGVGGGEGWGLVRELYAPNRREAKISLRSKRFRASSSRKIGTRAKKKENDQLSRNNSIGNACFAG